MTSEPKMKNLASEDMGRFVRVSLLVLGLGIGSVLLLWITHQVSEVPVREDMPLLHAVTELQLVVATSHLWLEEYLSGDDSVDLMADVWSKLDRAGSLSRLLLEGSDGADSDFVTTPLTDAGLRLRVIRIGDLVKAFRDRAMTRVSLRTSAGVGSDLDTEYDSVFRLLQREATILEETIETQIKAHQRRARILLGGIALTWIGVVALAVIGLAARERQGRLAQEALRRSEERLDATLHSIGDAVVSTDHAGRINFVNKVAEELTGWSEEEILGRPLVQVLRLSSEAAVGLRESAHEEALRRGTAAFRRDLLLERRDGERIPVDETAAPIRGRGGDSAGVVLVCRDVRERRKAETALRETETQLSQALKLEAVGRLAGGIAHDINNYLGAIANECALTKILRPGDRDIVRNADATLDIVGKASALIRRLLAFGRQQPVWREVVDLNRIVADLREVMERLIGEDIRLDIRLAEEPWNIEVDPSQVEQVVINLLVNAMEALPDGGRITVETGSSVVAAEDLVGADRVGAGEYAVLTVSDTGTGIDTAIREKIFEPFFTTKDNRSSSGLGLSTVYGIVRQSGGFLRLESEVGRGTTFRVFLPRSDRSAEVATPLPQAAPPLGRRRILVIEDNEVFRRSISRMIESLGHCTVTVPDGPAALAAFRSSPMDFDLVISDVLMPGLSGHEVARRLRWERPEVPVLFISGFTDRIEVEDLPGPSRVKFLAKPFSLEELQRAMTEVLANRSSASLAS